MIPEKLLDVLGNEGVVAIATQGEGKPHLVNTWNSYVQVTEEEHLLIPVGGMNETEANLGKNNHLEVTMGSREVEGKNGPGTGFLVEGAGEIIKTGWEFDAVKERFPWARAALIVKPNSISQTL